MTKTTLSNLLDLLGDIEGAMKEADTSGMYPDWRDRAIKHLAPVIGDIGVADAYILAKALFAEYKLRGAQEACPMLHATWILEAFMRDGSAGGPRDVRARVAHLQDYIEENGDIDEEHADSALLHLSFDINSMASGQFGNGETFAKWAAAAVQRPMAEAAE